MHVMPSPADGAVNAPIGAVTRLVCLPALICVTSACFVGAPPVSAPGFGPWLESPAAYYVLTEASVGGSVSRAEASTERIVLAALDDPDRTVVVDLTGSLEAAHDLAGRPFELLFGTKGHWEGPPAYAIYAQWEVPQDRAEAFLNNRRDLFDLRVRAIQSFHSDLMLRSTDRSDVYLVLGFYGEYEGLEAARGHPDVQAFAQANPVATYGARNPGGTHSFRIVQWSARD